MTDPCSFSDAEVVPGRSTGAGTLSPTFSVILPTHNRASMLRRAALSVLKQTRPDLELLIVDDASDDETEAEVNALEDPRVRYLRHQTRAGAAAARNTGIQAATGTYVAFIDSDDEWLPEKLAKQLEAIERSDLPSVGVVTCGETGVRGLDSATTRLPNRRGWIYEDLLAQGNIGCRTSALFVRRDVLDRHRIGFDAVLPARQDWDFVAQLTQVVQMEIVREPLVIVHHHDGDRVWTPARAVEAGLYLHDKFRSELESRPRAHNRFHLRIAMTCIANGDWPQARQQIREAIDASPSQLVSYLWLGLARTGRAKKPSLPQRAVMKLLRHLTF